MIRRRPQVAFTLVVLGALTLAGSRPARAYDSSGPDIKPQTHAQPTPAPPWPFGPPYFQASPDYANDFFQIAYSVNGPSPYETTAAKQEGVYNFQIRMLHDLQGANAEFGLDPDFGVSSGVLKCAWPQDNTLPSFGDWTQCTAWPATITNKMPGWAKVHRAWDMRAADASQNTSAPEHMDIALASAQAAGLGSLPLFNSTLWLRYPVNGSWLSTYVPAGVLQGGFAAGWATAPSWLPVDFTSMGALATRGFQLAELAQLPDVSNTVWDWASGDEICPVNGLDTTVTNPDGTQNVFSAFGSPAKDLNACHDFASVMGAINASHFMPLAQTYYHYYHALALDRMAQCFSMNQALAPVYAIQWSDPQWQATHSPNDSEVNVCEQEAFAYEMNAQHYLQDAWSTGHMWSRWGYPDLAPYPSDVGPYPNGQIEWPADLPARRMLIAGTVASYAGTIHGAKGVTGNFLSWAGSVADDPLCGPAYDDPANPQPASVLVQWTTPDKKVYPGVGDLFFNPYTGANLSSSVTYSSQREHLLACGARSLYDLYASGPESYGSVTPGSVEGLSITDPSLQSGPNFDTFCFGQSITNDSMSGALGAFYLTRNWLQILGVSLTPPLSRTAIFSLVNKILVLQRAGQVTFVDPGEEATFVALAVMKLGLDVQQLKAVLNARAVLDPKGTSSSKLIGPTPGTQLTMLGVPPNSQPPPTQPPSSFVDLLTSTPTGIPQDAVRHLFWRAHPEDVCSQDLVNTLRARCIAGAAFGGDAEACTSCVDVAELEVPTCSSQAGGGANDGGLATSPTPLIGPSKCAALNEAGPTNNLPQSWWDPNARVPTCDSFPSYWLAFSYCTGTDPLPIEGDTDYVWGRTVLATTPTTVVSACVDPLTQQASPLVNVSTRQAYAHRELSATAQTARPIVTAWNQVETEKEIVTWGPDGPGCLDYFTTDQDGLVQDLVPFPLFADPGPDTTPTLVSEDTLARFAPYTLPFCGTTQRLTVWDRNCGDVIGAFGGVLNLGSTPDPNVPLDPTTGIETMSVTTSTGAYAGEERCSLREARTFSMQCPPLTACSTSGICVPGRDSTGMPIGGVTAPPTIVVRP